MAKTYGYCRVSSKAQGEGTSLADQEARIRAYAKERKVQIARMFVEAESSIGRKAEQRAQMNELLSVVRKGDLVLCDKIDRWSRDAEFTYRTVRQILEAGASFFAVEERLDPSTPEGDTALGFRILFAREEAKRIRARMVGTRQVLRKQGYYVEGLAPYGYRRQAGEGQPRVNRNALIVEEGEAAIVRDMFRRCILGESIATIARALGLHRDLVADTLRKRFYTGEIDDGEGRWIKGKHDAIVDAGTFVAAGKALDARTLGGRPATMESETATWILRDLARCGLCGGKMTSAYAGPPTARRYYYHCRKGCPGYVPVRDRWVRSGKAKRLIEGVEGKAAAELVVRLNQIRAELSATPAAPKVPATSVEARRSKLEGKRARTLELYTDGTMTKPAMLAAVAKIDADLLALAVPVDVPVWDDGARRAALASFPGLLAGAASAVVGGAGRTIAGLLCQSVGLAAGAPNVYHWHDATPDRVAELAKVIAPYSPKNAPKDVHGALKAILDRALPRNRK